MTPRDIVICEHAPKRADAFRRWLPGARVLKRYEGESVPDSFDAIILSGGPMSAYAEDRRRFPFLEEEFHLVTEAAKGPSGSAPLVVGICLGAQLMTLALGGNVIQAELVAGWNAIEPSRPHPLYGWQPAVMQFEWHSNRIVRLPDGAELLARSATDSIEAFAWGEKMFATAYHPEIAMEDAVRIFTESGKSTAVLSLDSLGGAVEHPERASRTFFDFLF